MTNEKRIPSLDGIRAIAISLVVFSHLWFATYGSFPSEKRFDYGTLGVYIFFVLSGFLITSIMKREYEQAHSVSLKNFYTRRLFRIFPCLLGLLVGIKLLMMFGLASATDRQLLFCLTFLRNYFVGPYRILHHLWSLSVEEQFYLVWPFLFTRLSKRTVSWLLAGIIVTAPFIRLGALLWFWGKGSWHTEQVADALAWGCLLAIWQQDLRANRLYRWFSHSYATLILPLAIVVAADMRHQRTYALLGQSVIFLVVALGIDVLIQRHDSVVGNILNIGPVVWLGKISYSLYLWQQIFFFAGPGNPPYAWFPMNLVLAFLCAALSYYAIEQPAIRWGRAVVARRSLASRQPKPSAVDSCVTPSHVA